MLRVRRLADIREEFCCRAVWRRGICRYNGNL